MEVKARTEKAERVAEKRRTTTEKLSHTVRDAIKKKRRFFKIGDKWDRNDHKIFKDGIARYAGDSREEYFL